MDRNERLRVAAIRLLEVLRRYAQHDEDVADVLRPGNPTFMESFLLRIIDGEIMPSMVDPFGWYFYNSEAPLYEKLLYPKDPLYGDYRELHDDYLSYREELCEGL